MADSKLLGLVGVLALVAVGWYGIDHLLSHTDAESSRGTPNAVPENVQPAIPMPVQEATVCRTLENANRQFQPLQEEWNAAAQSGDGNEVRKQLALDRAKREIDDLFHERNATILNVLGRQQPRAENWIIRVAGLSSTEKDFGNGTHRYLTLKGMLTCHAPVSVTMDDILETPEVVNFTSRLNIGDFITVSGRLLLHDADANPPEVAVEWGGPLWGPFGGLWNDAFEKPGYRFAVEHWSRS